MEVPLKQVRTTFYVREVIDEADIERLALLIIDGAVLDPIVVDRIDDGGATPIYEVIDGRTRLRAYESLEYETVSVRLYDGERTRLSKFVAAVQANDSSGPIPLNKRDIIRAVRKLKEEGATDAQVKSAFPSYRKFVREALTFARSNIVQSKVTEAVALIASEGLNAREAALRVGVDEDKVKERLKKQKGQESRALSLDKRMTEAHRSYGQSLRKFNESLNDSIEAGEIPTKTAMKLLMRQKHHAQELLRRAEDRISRLMSTRPGDDLGLGASWNGHASD